VRRIAVLLLLLITLSGCSGPDQKIRETGAQAARDAASEVSTFRLAVQQLLEHNLWSQPANQLVKDAEKALGRVATSFDSQQPETEESRQVFNEITQAIDDAETAVTTTRIALGNDDLTAAARQVAVLEQAAKKLGELGELAK
jgi:ABC-type sugar transport system substrate-binding protein